MSKTCANCTAEVPQETLVCGNCGMPISEAPSSKEGPRQEVSTQNPPTASPTLPPPVEQPTIDAPLPQKGRDWEQPTTRREKAPSQPPPARPASPPPLPPPPKVESPPTNVMPPSRDTVPGRELAIRPSSVPQRLPSRNKTRLLLAAVIGILLLLLVGGGAMALSFGLFTDWWGGLKTEPATENPPDQPSESRSAVTAKKEGSEGKAASPSGASVAPKEDTKLEDDLRGAVKDYYEAVDRQDWNYTYDNLDSDTKGKYTRDEYVQKNLYLAGVDPLAQSSPRIVSEISTSSPVEVELTQTFRSGLTRSRTTYFVREDGAWKHRFSQQDDDVFLPDASYEEFLKAKQSGA